MRVLHVLEATQGGTRRHVLDLISALLKRGVACDLIYSPLRHAAFERDARRLEALGARTWALPMARGFHPSVDAPTLQALRAHWKQRPDIVHLHSTKAGLLGRIVQSTLKSSARPAVVYTPHCVAFDTLLPRHQRRAARWIEWSLSPLTAAFIAVSQHENRALRAAGIGDAARRHVVYNGIDLDAFDSLVDSAASKGFEAQEAAFIIGCFGRLTRQKNQGALLQALPSLLEAQSTARLLLVGGGEDEASLRALAQRLGVASRVTWTGELDEARALYARCDLVAQPSRWEGCPYSVLEAMAARRPVISTPVGGVREVLGESDGAGVLSRPDQFAAHLSQLTHDTDCRAALGQAARQRVEKYFALDAMIEGTLRVYQSVLKR